MRSRSLCGLLLVSLSLLPGCFENPMLRSSGVAQSFGARTTPAPTDSRASGADEPPRSSPTPAPVAVATPTPLPTPIPVKRAAQYRLTPDFDGDGRGDLCAEQGGLRCWSWSDDAGYQAAFTASNIPMDEILAAPSLYSTVQYPDLNGDGKTDLCARKADGLYCWLSTGDGFALAPGFPLSHFSNEEAWGAPQYYSTLQFADVNGDGRDDLCFRGKNGLDCLLSTPDGLQAAPGFHLDAFGDGADGVGTRASVYSTLRYPDLNGDGKADVCGRTPAGYDCWLSTGTGFVHADGFPLTRFNDTAGWRSDLYFPSIQFADLNGDGLPDLCARSAAGLECWLNDPAATPRLKQAIVSADFSDERLKPPSRFSTVQFLDLDGDGKSDVCARFEDGVHCYLSTGSALVEAKGFRLPELGNQIAENTRPEVYTTLSARDVNGDGKEDLCVSTGAGLECYLSTGTGFTRQMGLAGYHTSHPAQYLLLRHAGYIPPTPKAAITSVTTSVEKATVSFAADTSAHFKCHLDGKTVADCHSPFPSAGMTLPAGPHRLVVEASNWIGIATEVAVSFQVAAPAPTESKLVETTMEALQAKIGNASCFGTWGVVHSLTCESGASRLCRGMGYDGGIIQSYDSISGLNRVSVLCIKSSMPQFSVGIDTLNQKVGGACPPGDWASSVYKSLTCGSAADRICRDRGAAGGVIQEWDGTNASITCITNGSYQANQVLSSTLSAIYGGCGNDWGVDGAHRLFCDYAAGIYCRDRGYQGGAVQEYAASANGVEFTCIR